MHLLRFIPIRLTILLIVGILTAQITGLPLEFPFLLAGTALLLLALKLSGLLHIPAVVHGILIALVALSLGILSYAIALPENQQQHYLRHDFKGRHLMYLRIREVWKPTAYSSRYLAMLEQVDCLKVKGGVLLNISPSPSRPLKVDALVLVKGSLAEIKPNLNPFQFNYGRYLKNLGLPRQLTADSSQIVLLNEVETTLLGKAEGIRDRVESGLKTAGMGNDALSIVSALLLGQRADISEDTFTAFRDAGAIHILAVSGLHIGILLLLLNFLLQPLDRLPGGRGIKLCLLLILLWGYALLAGFTPSIIRAVSMFSFVAYALYLNRPANSYNILALSVFFILLAIDPGLLFQVGFQMSYAAVFAIVWFLPLLHKIWAPGNRIMRQCWQLLSVSLAAQIGVLPISLFYFHRFPGLFFLSNLIIIPFLGILLGFGFLVASMAYTVGLPKFLADIYELLINLMTGLVHLISEQEAFIIKDIPFAIPELLFLYLLIVLLARLLAKYSIGRVKILLLAVMLMQCQICWLAYSMNGVEKVWVLHRPRQTLLMHQAGAALFASSAESGIPDENLLTGFKLATRCRKLSTVPLRKAYRWDASSLVVLGANSGWPAPDGRKLYLLMTGSPKFHMGRLLDSLRPAVVVVDGSNYPSYVARWKASCEKRKISFHYTGTDGAYGLQIAGN